MVFSDLLFIYLFLPLCLVLYYIIGNKTWKNGILIIFSLIFYSFGEPVWVCLLILSSICDYLCGLFIEKHRKEKKKTAGLVISLIFNIGILALFKYGGFIVSNVNALAGTDLAVPDNILPPLGISFYTFQTLSYTIDVYRGKVEVQHSFFRFLLYVSMFFQLVAGPIVRYSDICGELDGRKVTAADISQGFSRFALGLGKKVIIANCVGEIADEFLLFENTPDSVLALWSGIILYSLQIYFDFSGYSDMAIGIGRLFGFHLPENFNYPYISKSASEFWRRWHITMGSFFRDYVYIPMGGNRRHQALNIAVVWLLTGLWHGASWNFVIWGAYFGILVTAEKFFTGKILEKLPSFLSHTYLLICVIFGWIIFYYEDLSDMKNCLTGMFGGMDIPLYDDVSLSRLAGICFVIAAAVIFSCPVFKIFKEKAMNAAEISVPASAALTLIWDMLIIAVFIASSLLLAKQAGFNPFLYFRF